MTLEIGKTDNCLVILDQTFIYIHVRSAMTRFSALELTSVSQNKSLSRNHSCVIRSLIIFERKRGMGYEISIFRKQNQCNFRKMQKTDHVHIYGYTFYRGDIFIASRKCIRNSLFNAKNKL